MVDNVNYGARFVRNPEWPYSEYKRVLNEPGMARLEQIVNRVYALLTETRLGPVWADGGVSAHRDLAFRYRTSASGQCEEPLVTFVSFSNVQSVVENRQRINQAVADPARRTVLTARPRTPAPAVVATSTM